jgi:hypothetical protein
VLVVRQNVDPERLAARPTAGAATTVLPLGRDHARLRAAAATLALPLAVAAVAVAAALPGAAGHALYGDEVASARIVTEPALPDVLRHVRRTESTPPAWYVVAWTARKATGADVQSLRLLSVLFAAAAAALTAVWALCLLGSRPAAALAGSLVALGSVPAEYAEQLRAYALVVLLSVAFGMLLGEAALRPAGRWLVGLALATWLGALTHYFFAFVVVAGIAWLWAARPRPPAASRATLAIAAGAVACAPWLPSFLEQQAHGRYRWIGPFDAAQVATLPGELFFGSDGLFYGLARLAVTAAVVAGAIHVWWRREEATVVAALGLLPIAAAGLVWATGEPIFNERNMLPVAPFLAILVAAGVKALPARLVPAVAAFAIVAALGGAAYAEATLGRVAYDSAATALTGPRLDDPRRADRRLPDGLRGPAWGRDPDHLRGLVVPARAAAPPLGTRAARLPHPLRDRADAERAGLARAGPRPGDGVARLHLLRPPDPRPAAGHRPRRPLPPPDPPAGCGLLRARLEGAVPPVSQSSAPSVHVVGTSPPPSSAIRGPKRTKAGCDAILPATSDSP